MEVTYSHQEIFWLILITLLGVIFSVFLHLPLFIGFLPGVLFLFYLGKKKNLPTKQLFSMGKSGALKTKEVIIILSLVSFILPTWYLSGTIDEMVKVSLHIISPEHFLLSSFILMACLSMLLGTTIGSLSALGIPIMSTALTLGIPPEMVAGVIVSGAYVGDRSSPFSSAFQLLASTVEIPSNKQFRKLIPTGLLAIIICLVLFHLLDHHLAHSVVKTEHLKINWSMQTYLAFLPPIILLIFVLCRIGIKYAFIGSILSASMLAYFKGIGITKLIYHLWMGVSPIGGGLKNMLFLLIFLALAGFFNGIVEETSLFQPIMNKWLANSRSLFESTWKTMAATLVISLLACNQTLPIILTGRTFLPHWEKNYSNGQLARTMADSTCPFPCMIPWSVMAILSSTIIGVPILAYLPYLFFLWLLPLLTIGYSLAQDLYEKYRKKGLS